MPASVFEPPGCWQAMKTDREVQHGDIAAQSDREILDLILLRGDTDSFEILVSRYQKYLFTVAGRYLPFSAVEEVVHEAFIEAFKSLGSFRAESPFKFWLRGVLVRSCYQYWRRTKQDRLHVQSNLSDEARKWCEDVFSAEATRRHYESEAKSEAREVIEFALSQLSAQDRMVVSLVHLEGYSTSEAARLLGWTTANVKVRAFRSRKMLRAIVEKSIEGISDG